MKNMGLRILAISFLLSATVQVVFADESVTEGVAASANDAKRGLKKGAHRTAELLCVQGDVECAAKKAKNRLIEAGDAAADGVKKVKNKID